MSAGYAIVAIAVVTVVTVLIGSRGLRRSRTTSDFYVASRTVSATWNASAISGEYLSAASFLGVAGLVMAYGADMLWYPVGYTAGYLVLLLLVAAPLRRSGAYTLPDFAEARLGSPAVRRMASVLVVVVGWLYLVPQLRGAGLTLHVITGAPPWLGALIIVTVVVASVSVGGMRSITAVQAFQYCVKITAITIPLLFIGFAWSGQGAPQVTDHDVPVFPSATTVRFDTATRVRVRAPVAVTAHGTVDGRRAGGALPLAAGRHTVAADAHLTFPAGAAAPVMDGSAIEGNRAWASPLNGANGHGHPLYATYSLVIATFLGTMGLPHILVRFYTNPDGRAARRTALAVLGLLGGFYLLPTAYGALGRIYAPELLVTGDTDAIVLLLPGHLVPGLAGRLLGALVTAGAFAAFLSTSSGLTMSVAGVLAQDILSGLRRYHPFRIGTVAAICVPFAIAVSTGGVPIARAVGLPFAVAASSFCPLLLLGIWWRGLTAAGAAAGLVAGGGLATAAVIVSTLVPALRGWPRELLAEPSALTVPIAFLVMIVVSRLTRRRLRPGIASVMVRMHAPESVRPDTGDPRRVDR
ncbi:sodium/solute symporter [Actinomadura macra]|uniref:sodium/solute symporter n=1 Tax=Actinomadura macra TaxID=46164 RepID=UPI000834A723|nr:cation acetate symporter [Actinomadura macra]